MWATCSAINAQQEGLDAVTRAQIFTLNHLIAWQDSFNLAHFNDGVATFHALDRAGHQVFATFQEVLKERFTLSVADLLQNNLFGSLCANTTKIDRFQLFFNGIAYFDIGVLFAGFTDWQLRVFVFEIRILNDFPATERFVITGFAVDNDANIGFKVHLFASSLCQCELKRCKDDFLADVLFSGQRID